MRPLVRLSLPFLALPAIAAAQGTDRAIRRDIPITNAIRKAFAAGSRDSTGMPSRNYWQLRTDYSIQARIDPATQTITGTETIKLVNPSPDSLTEIRLRLDHNIFRPRSTLGLSRPAENTDGMVVTDIKVNGQPVGLTAPAGGRGGRGGAGAPSPTDGVRSRLRHPP